MSTGSPVIVRVHIDFSEDFLWFDDNLFESEKRVLAEHGCEGKFVLIDLKGNARQLEDLL